MSQQATVRVERRREQRRPAAFAIWHRRPYASLRRSGWMTDIAASGAAFLMADQAVPTVGDWIVVEPMDGPKPLDDVVPRIPPLARVVRVQPGGGATQRVAIRFENGRLARRPVPAWNDDRVGLNPPIGTARPALGPRQDRW